MAYAHKVTTEFLGDTYTVGTNIFFSPNEAINIINGTYSIAVLCAALISPQYLAAILIAKFLFSTALEGSKRKDHNNNKLHYHGVRVKISYLSIPMVIVLSR